MAKLFDVFCQLAKISFLSGLKTPGRSLPERRGFLVKSIRRAEKRYGAERELHWTKISGKCKKRHGHFLTRDTAGITGLIEGKIAAKLYLGLKSSVPASNCDYSS